MNNILELLQNRVSDNAAILGKEISLNQEHSNCSGTTIMNPTLSNDALKSNGFGDYYRSGMITPISPGFDPQPNAIYTPYSLARHLHISEKAARAYFRSLEIPLLFGAGYLGSDIIAATEELKNGTLTVKPAKCGRQEIPTSNAPKYITRHLETQPQAKNSPLAEFKKSLNCKTVSSKTRLLGAVIPFHPTPKENDNDD